MLCLSKTASVQPRVHVKYIYARVDLRTLLPIYMARRVPLTVEKVQEPVDLSIEPYTLLSTCGLATTHSMIPYFLTQYQTYQR
jgi:hypothetical protein